MQPLVELVNSWSVDRERGIFAARETPVPQWTPLCLISSAHSGAISYFGILNLKIN